MKLSEMMLSDVGAEASCYATGVAQLEEENERLAEYRDSIDGWMWKYLGTDRTNRCRICGGKYPDHDVFGCSLADALLVTEEPE